MPNCFLYDQFHVRISVLVYTCRVSSKVKGNPGLKVNSTQVMCFVWHCLGLDLEYFFRNCFDSSALYDYLKAIHNKFIVLMRMNWHILYPALSRMLG